MSGDPPDSDPPIEDVYRALVDLGHLINAIIADGQLSTQEIHFLGQWLEASKAIEDVHPASTICRRVREVLRDGNITREEKEMLLDELRSYSSPV